MKKTIREDNNRNIIRTDYLNDNLLIECTYDSNEDTVTISIRFVKELNTITEITLMTIKMGEYIESYQDLIRINSTKDTIAVFKKIGTDFMLDRIYDVNEHSTVPEDFKDVVFKQKFPQEKLGKNLVLEKPMSGGVIYWQA